MIWRATTIRTAARYAAIYLAWGITGALGIADLIGAREAILRLYVMLRLGKWGYGAADKWLFVFFGLIWLVGILYMESYYRTGAAKGVLARRFLRVTLIELAILAVAWGVHVLTL
ncbi:MAG: hypothetical protein GXP39_09310 [Chloroflexi bacterium]|nr:hypothetical protein [Chloroflexota bacterium]